MSPNARPSPTNAAQKRPTDLEYHARFLGGLSDVIVGLEKLSLRRGKKHKSSKDSQRNPSHKKAARQDLDEKTLSLISNQNF
jgi:hypothetical protein